MSKDFSSSLATANYNELRYITHFVIVSSWHGTIPEKPCMLSFCSPET
jgi:hypothetical protein